MGVSCKGPCIWDWYLTDLYQYRDSSYKKIKSLSCRLVNHIEQLSYLMMSSIAICRGGLWVLVNLLVWIKVVLERHIVAKHQCLPTACVLLLEAMEQAAVQVFLWHHFLGGVLRQRGFVLCGKHWHPCICLCNSDKLVGSVSSCLTAAAKYCWVPGTNDCHFMRKMLGKAWYGFKYQIMALLKRLNQHLSKSQQVIW